MKETNQIFWQIRQSHVAYLDLSILLNLKSLSANPQNHQTQSNNLSIVADKLFQCVLPFLGMALKVLKFC